MANALYNRVAWEVNVDDIVVNSTTYTINFTPENPNDPGYGSLSVGYYLIDFAGYVYYIDTILSSTSIEVSDVYDITNSNGPYVNRPAFIYESKHGAIILTQAQLRRLDKSAIDNILPVEKGVIWNHRGVELLEAGISKGLNITKIDFTSGAAITFEGNTGWQGGNKASIAISGGSSSGEANTASNLGTGTGIFAQKTGIDLQFKSIVAGTGISLANDSNTITVTSTVAGTTPGGSNKSIQFNNSGAFGGFGSYDSGTQTIHIASSVANDITHAGTGFIFGDYIAGTGASSIVFGAGSATSDITINGGNSYFMSVNVHDNCNIPSDYTAIIGGRDNLGTTSYNDYSTILGCYKGNINTSNEAQFCAIINSYITTIEGSAEGAENQKGVTAIGLRNKTITNPTKGTLYTHHIELLNRDTGVATRVVMASPNGTRYAVTVDNSGNLVTALA